METKNLKVMLIGLLFFILLVSYVTANIVNVQPEEHEFNPMYNGAIIEEKNIVFNFSLETYTEEDIKLLQTVPFEIKVPIEKYEECRTSYNMSMEDCRGEVIKEARILYLQKIQVERERLKALKEKYSSLTNIAKELRASQFNTFNTTVEKAELS